MKHLRCLLRLLWPASPATKALKHATEYRVFARVMLGGRSGPETRLVDITCLATWSGEIAILIALAIAIVGRWGRDRLQCCKLQFKLFLAGQKKK